MTMAKSKKPKSKKPNLHFLAKKGKEHYGEKMQKIMINRKGFRVVRKTT